ncbi:hypothetical protein CVV43_05025 [Candidatus Saccharibacteria bacterium HGW-Saccharibacteria-1]|jgi:hypothetical protein|nr:MAG: hypothetical protein CVV43_05025 [Candidatus Saccharibacteria bacterium HGW-Saccharibacteria-1]
MDGDNNNIGTDKQDNDSATRSDDIKQSIEQLPDDSYPKRINDPVQTQWQSVEPTLKSKKSKKPLVIIILILILIASLAGAWYAVFYKSQQSDSVKKTDNTTADKTKSEVITDPQLLEFITPTTGETWLAKPVAVAKQGFYLKTGLSEDESEAEYFKVGSNGEDVIYMVSMPGVGGTFNTLFEKSSDGQITLVNHPDGNGVYSAEGDSYLATTLSKGVKISNDIHYDSLSIPDQIKIDDKGSVVLSPTYPNIGFAYTEPKSGNIKQTLIKQLGGSALYKYESTNTETKLVSISYFIKSPLNNQVALRYTPLELSLANYKWSVGYADVNDSLKPITYGCGSMGASVTRSDALKDADLQVTGKSGNNLTVYGFKDTSNDLFKKAYNEFIEFYKGDTTSNKSSMTQEEFLKSNAVVVFKDVNNDWLVYTRKDLSPAAGCAKPVIYLYPKTQQVVNVKVGADVKISEPNYNAAKGWTAVANPNGQLVVDGNQYSSLFWEGPGIGEYPEITKGTVVKNSEVVKTIHTQLVAQGLNNNEINDFMQYWQDKIPTSPFVRLTWFDTAQMDKLAPLKVSPKPDTSIRIFLDMAGLEKSINIPRQDLKSIPRKGFTLVEWGGLSTRKLY